MPPSIELDLCSLIFMQIYILFPFKLRVDLSILKHSFLLEVNYTYLNLIINFLMLISPLNTFNVNKSCKEVIAKNINIYI